MNKIIPKVKILATSDGSNELTKSVNSFLSTIDVRQILKIQYQFPDVKRHGCMIVYIDFEDIRDLKVESILENKII